MLTPELSGNSGTQIADIGGVCHEYGHILGAPDFYDTDKESSGGKYPGTGYYDVMGDGNWNGSGDGRCPAHHNPYTKIFIYGWAMPSNLILPTPNRKLYTLRPSHIYKDLYIMVTQTPDEIFIIENKQRIEFNSAIPNSGLLIYHIHKYMQSAIPLNAVNVRHQQRCYIVNAGATSNPNKNPNSYGYRSYSTQNSWTFPTNDKIFFTSTSIPSATSWVGEATGANICFIQSVGSKIQFVVNPEITGPSTLSDSATYCVSNIPSCAKIKWTYTFIPNTASQNNSSRSPIIFVNGDNMSSVLIERGKYPVIMNRGDLTKTMTINTPTVVEGNLRDKNIVGWGTTEPLATLMEYFSGKAILQVTITSGGQTHVIVKIITLANTKKAEPVRLAADVSSEEDFEQQKSTEEQQVANKYRLIYTNPVVTNSVCIRIDKNEDDVFVPYHGDYTLCVCGDRIGLIQLAACAQPYYMFDCSNLPMGVYQLLLQIDNQIVATSKMLKLY